MGQGAGMAMEDAAVLAEELAAASRGETTLADPLPRYERRRRDRVETISRLSRAVIDRGQLTGRFACWRHNRQVVCDGRDVERMQNSLAPLLAWPRPVSF